ncbi:GTPase Era [bacterium]|jgi:GTP-binding protein Era|nr:GTPase Era [bacterium]
MKAGVATLIGRPNVGKSSFLNRILREEISIVTPKAQTTRDQVRGILNEERGQIVLVDTPGIHRAREGGINEYMIQEVRRALDGPDLVLYLIDPMSKAEAERKVLEFLKGADSRLLALVNKADLKRKHASQFEWIAPWIEELKAALANTRCPFLGVREISAGKGTGIPELLGEIFNLLPEGQPLFDDPDTLTDRSARFVVAELIRKQLFLKLGDELPYSCAVEIESYQEREKPVRISALIHVERDSQKGMVIGAGGKKIKEIGTAARIGIEHLLQEKVFLELRVKVLEAWTSQAKKMKGLGYILE